MKSGPPRNLQTIDETSSTITIAFLPPHVGPTTMYEIEYQLGYLIKTSDDTETIDTTKSLRNMQHKLRPRGAWLHSGYIYEESTSTNENPSDLVKTPQDSDEDDEDKEIELQHVQANKSSKQEKDTTAEELLNPNINHCFTLKNLLSNEFYKVRVSAKNGNGNGEAIQSSLWIKTLPLPPTPSSMPPFVNGRSSRTLNLQWEQANGFGEIVLSYIIEMRERPGKLYEEQSSSDEEEESEKNDEQIEKIENQKYRKWIVVGQVAKSTDEDDHWRQLEVMNLIPGKTYEFRLKAQSVFGIGAASKISRCAQCEYEPPEIIDTLRGELDGKNENMIKLRWNEPHAWELNVDVYEIEMQSKQNLNQWIHVCETEKKSRYVGSDVVPKGIPHRFRIRSASRIGYSKWSKETKWLILLGD